MYSWRNFVDKFKRYAPLESSEKRGLIITILILSFIFSFRDWGVEQFDAALGFQHFIITLVIVIIAMAIHELTHRVIALWLGYRSQYKTWILGLVIGLVVAFIYNGHWVFIAPGALIITHLTSHRLGKFWYDLNYKQLGWIGMSGAIANMLFAVLLKSLHLATGVGLFEKAMMINIWIALFDMLPIPPFNGSRTFYGSRFIYVFVLGSMIGCAALLAFVSGIAALLGALVLGSLILFVFFAFMDKRW
jgi:Zn-dependent protease